MNPLRRLTAPSSKACAWLLAGALGLSAHAAEPLASAASTQASKEASKPPQAAAKAPRKGASAPLLTVELNRATQAELESVPGVGPALSAKLLQARAQAPFKDWADVIERVKGVGEKSAARLSAAGLTVQGQSLALALVSPRTVPVAPAAAAR